MNKGFDPEVIRIFKAEIENAGLPYRLNADAENSSEYVEFQFVGQHEGREVLFDAALYTLRLQHESELFDIAEQRAMEQFPDYRKVTEDDAADPEREEEIGLFMAEVIMELEEEESVKVQEHVDVDTGVEFGISLDIGLNVEAVTRDIILKFIEGFTTDTLKLDQTLYSFQTEEEAD
jgi:hypothetical protein